jgi:C4-dicarboxylate-specific signal transduction histidine kinase
MRPTILPMPTVSAIDKAEATEARPLSSRLSDRVHAQWIPGAGLMVLAFGLLVVASLLMAANQARLHDSMRWVDRTQSIVREAAALDIALVDVEAAARAYSLTGDQSFVGSYQMARKSVDDATAALGALVADNPVQSARLDALGPLLAQRMKRIETIVKADPSQSAAFFTPERIREGQALRKQVRAGLDAFRSDELDLLREREVYADAAATRSIWLVVVMVALSGMTAWLGLYLLQRERAQQRIRELQIELHHLSRVTTMGQTASMLAHEINQPLSATTNYLEASRRVLENEESPKAVKAAEMIKKASAQVHRAGEIVARLRRFIGKQETGRAPEDVETLITDAVSLLGTLGDGVHLRTEVAPNLPAILVDRVQIQQVLVNLARNAVEAMGNQGGSNLKISAIFQEPEAVRLSVVDNGPGLPDTVTRQLFKPFVSTKPDGMGIGLSICRAILLDHGGRIWVEPNPDGGTAFHFTVPAAASRKAA